MTPPPPPVPSFLVNAQVSQSLPLGLIAKFPASVPAQVGNKGSLKASRSLSCDVFTHSQKLFKVFLKSFSSRNEKGGREEEATLSAPTFTNPSLRPASTGKFNE